MKSSNHFKIEVILLTLFLFLKSPAFAQEIKLTNFNINNTRDDVMLYFNVKGAFQEKIKQSVLIGVPVTFSFFVTIYQIRDMWIDKKTEELEINHTIKYNTLKKEFAVRRSWEKENLQITKSFSEAQKLMNNVDQLKVVSLSRLEKDRKYQIRVKAEIIKDRQPIDIHYVSDLLAKWNPTTEWYTIDFIY